VDSEDAEIAAAVQRQGWFAIAVEGTDEEPSFTYTIGLCDRLGHPEIIALGLEEEPAYGLVSDLVALARSGRRYRPREKILDLILGCPVMLLPVHRTHVLCRMGYALGYCRHVSKPDVLQAVQLLWPDRAGRLPIEVGCEPDVASLQPRLDLPMPSDEFREFMERYGPVPT
jgi:hypothetical protein